MKKSVVFCILGLLLLAGCHKKTEVKQVAEESTRLTQSTSIVEEKEQNFQGFETQETEKQVIDPKKMLLDFGNHFLNFDSLQERNQSVKAYMTEKCQEENGINVDLNAEFKSVGKIEEVFQDVEDSQIYALLGYENSRGVKNEVFFVMKLVEENGEYKIDSFRYDQLHIH
ncbi:EF0163 family protein [Enterococcus hirae]